MLDTYRFEGHYIGDPVVYRTKEETSTWKARDPILREREYLLRNGLASEADLDRVQTEIARELDEAVIFAGNAPNPDPADLFSDVYSE